MADDITLEELEEGESEYETDEESEDETDSEEEEDEPKLKYQRLGSTVSELLRHDVATAMALHDKFLALGTKSGQVAILDFNGNMTHNYKPHVHPIQQLSIETTGEFVGSCAADGKVVVYGLYTKEKISNSYGRAVLSMALDPDFAKKETRQFVSGGHAGKLVLNTKGFLGFGSRDVVLHSGEGPIYAISWSGQLIAWANNLGVKIYDCNIKQRITYISRPKGSPPPDQYQCHLMWVAEDTLFIGWADCLKIAVIKERRDGSSSLPNRYVEIVAILQTDFMISGVGSFGEYIVLLAFITDDSSDQEEGRSSKAISSGSPSRPELRILTRANEEVSSDALSIIGFEKYNVRDYQLHHLMGESLFYVVSPHDIVMAKPCDLDDHITWLLDREKYSEALEAAERNEELLKTHKLLDIGERYLNYLISHAKVDVAASNCQRILKNDPQLWEKWIFVFAKIRQLKAISTYIPIHNPTLSDTVYEIVLNNFLQSDHPRFLQTIDEWPCSLYNVRTIITSVQENLKRHPDSHPLMEALALLFSYNNQFDDALHAYLKLGKGDVFGLILQHGLYEAIQDKIALLMKFDEDKAIALLLSHPNRIRVNTVVQQLEREGEQELLHKFLHAVFKKDPNSGRDFHYLQVALYADFDPQHLLPFLRQSHYYPLEEALEICQKHKMYPETVFILGRMGSSKEALRLIIDELQDVKQAIDFVSSQNDDELWEDLIESSMKDERFISGLLENIGGHVDPIRLISRIPEGKKIPGLRDRLVNIISDYNLEMSLREGCNVILKADVVELAEKYVRGQKRGVRVDTSAVCASCDERILRSEKKGGLVIFFCRHVYHSQCIIPKLSGDRTGTASRSTRSSTSGPNLEALSGNRASIIGEGVPANLAGSLHCLRCDREQRRNTGVAGDRVSRRSSAKIR